MFNVGDKVVYPMHGAGVIESIEEQEILGEKHRYYVMRLPVGELKVMIPMNNVQELGLRQIIGEVDVEKVLEVLQGERSKMAQNWNRRYRANREKIRSGDIFEVAEVVRNLALRQKEKGLSTGERRMLDNARQILVSELVLAKGVSERQIEDLLDRVLT